MDLAPTMLELAGIAKPAAMQGESWLPLLDNPTAPWRTDWYYEHTFTTRPPEKIAKSEGVRTERWKYIRWLDPKPQVEELFDLQQDPQESHNLSADPTHAETLRQLRERYQYWRRTLPDNAPDEDEYRDGMPGQSDGPVTKACD
jgi:arylsulfatase A-like enzyme